MRTLAKNATLGMLLVNGPWMLVYDAAYVAFASVTGAHAGAAARPRERAARVARLPPPRHAAPPPAAARRPLGFRRALQRHKGYTEHQPVGAEQG